MNVAGKVLSLFDSTAHSVPARRAKEPSNVGWSLLPPRLATIGLESIIR